MSFPVKQFPVILDQLTTSALCRSDLSWMATSVDIGNRSQKLVHDRLRCYAGYVDWTRSMRWSKEYHKPEMKEKYVIAF